MQLLAEVRDYLPAHTSINSSGEGLVSLVPEALLYPFVEYCITRRYTGYVMEMRLCWIITANTLCFRYGWSENNSHARYYTTTQLYKADTNSCLDCLIDVFKRQPLSDVLLRALRQCSAVRNPVVRDQTFRVLRLCTVIVNYTHCQESIALSEGDA